MNKNCKNTKGITLIALIITIIIMLILVGVTVNIALGGGLFSAAQGAARNTQQAVEDEANLSGLDLEEYASSFKSGGWTYNHASQTVTKGETTLKIGDYVAYTTPNDKIDYTTYNLGDGTSWKYGEGRNGGEKEGWRILGVDDNGRLLLVSETVINQNANYVTKIAGDAEATEDETDIDYSKALETLKKICEPFADGTIAIDGRSLNVSDINKLTGYNPESTGTGAKYGAGGINEYQNKVTIGKGSTGYTFTGTNGVTATTTAEFRNLGETSALTSSIDLTNEYYIYYLENLNSTHPGSYDNDNVVNNLIFSSAYHTDVFRYWLADDYVTVEMKNGEPRVRWGIRCVEVDSTATDDGDGKVIKGGWVWDGTDTASSGYNRTTGNFVRAVLTLAEDISFVGGDGTKASPWEMGLKIDLSGEVGSKVNYSAGGIDEWRILTKFSEGSSSVIQIIGIGGPVSSESELDELIELCESSIIDDFLLGVGCCEVDSGFFAPEVIEGYKTVTDRWMLLEDMLGAEFEGEFYAGKNESTAGSGTFIFTTYNFDNVSVADKTTTRSESNGFTRCVCLPDGEFRG